MRAAHKILKLPVRLKKPGSAQESLSFLNAIEMLFGTFVFNETSLGGRWMLSYQGILLTHQLPALLAVI